MRKFNLAVVAVTGASLLLAGCGVGDKKGDSDRTVKSDAPLKGSITFQTWALKNDKFSPYFKDLAAAFEKQHPGTKINWVDQPGDGYSTKVTSQVTGGKLPDVVNLPPDIAHSVAATGNLLNLSKNVPTLDKEYVSSGLSAYKYPDIGGGRDSYGFPWYLGTDINYWNKDTMARDGLDANKPPKTFDELVAQAKVMHDESGGKDYLMSRPPGLSDIVNSGTQLLSQDGKRFAFNTPEAAEVIEKYAKAYQAGYLPKNVLTNTYQGNAALFSKQQVAWTTGGGRYIQSLQETNPNLSKLVVPSLAIDTPPLYVQGISVAAKSKNLPLALAFAKFMTNNENQVAFIKLAQGFLPGTTEAADDPAYSKSDGTPAGDAGVFAYQAMQKAVNFTPAQWTDAMNTELNQQIALAMTGKQSADKALDNAVRQANQLLAQ